MARQAQMDVPSDQTFAGFPNYFPAIPSLPRIFIRCTRKCRPRLAPAASIKTWKNRRLRPWFVAVRGNTRKKSSNACLRKESCEYCSRSVDCTRATANFRFEFSFNEIKRADGWSYSLECPSRNSAVSEHFRKRRGNFARGTLLNWRNF